MANKIKRPNDPALTQVQATAATTVTETDKLLIRAIWLRRISNFEQRIREVSGEAE